jgi:uncharacterized membrane protein
MVLKIYIICAIAGLLYPIIDSLALRSKHFREISIKPASKNIAEYRDFPAWMKILAAFIPIFNAIWLVTIFLIARFFILNWWYGRVERFLWWLAGTSIKKHLMFKMKLVKKVFPGYKEYYYKSLEKRHWNYKLAKDISRILVKIAAAAEGKDSDQAFNDALDLVPDNKESDERKREN